MDEEEQEKLNYIFSGPFAGCARNIPDLALFNEKIT